jgi:Reverse transcriptase (RNA-dependent DNA polymerase)
VHTVRRLIAHHLDAAVSPDWALLQVDFSNAFNLVRRDVSCQSTLEHFPAPGPWVTWCYFSPSHLFYEGEIVCNGARGVQQGDPLGPLLFCLVLRYVSLGIADIFTSAEPKPASLDTLYLDDGVIGHLGISLPSFVLSSVAPGPGSWAVAELSQMLCLSA